MLGVVDEMRFYVFLFEFLILDYLMVFGCFICYILLVDRVNIVY